MDEETRKYIVEQVHMQVHNAIQKNERMISSIQKQQNEMYENILNGVESAVERKINGKLDKLNQKLEQHIEESKPTIAFFNHMNFNKRFLMWVAGFVGAVGSAIAGIVAVIKGIK